MIELKTCPVCGDKAELLEHKFGCASTFAVRCWTCASQTSQFFDNKETAIEVWNRRENGQIVFRHVLADDCCIFLEDYIDCSV